jgi:hypothetical protein
MSAGLGHVNVRSGRRRGAVLMGALWLLAACATGGFAFRKAVVGNGATPPAGMGDGARAMQATAGQAIAGTGGDGSRTLVHGFWARGGVLMVGVDDGPPTGSRPKALALGPPHPNPARAGTSFTLAIPEPGDVRLDVFDLQGRWVQNLVEGRLPAGVRSVQWNASVRPGVYLARLSVGGARVAERRLIVVH